MGYCNFFRALPVHDELVRLELDDKDVAEDALYPVLLFDVPVFSEPWVASYPRSQLARDLVKRYPKLREWYLDAGKWEPVQVARMLYYAAAGAAQAPYGELAFEQSLALKLTQGDRIFSEKFKSGTGFAIRVSSPEVVREILQFGQSLDPAPLPEGLRRLFEELLAFYQTATNDNLAVFVMRD